MRLRDGGRCRLVLGLLTWNSGEASRRALESLQHEARELRSGGADVSIAVCDNGSTDDTATLLREQLDLGEDGDALYQLDRNQGPSVGRNVLIDAALAVRADAVFFNDADVICPPGFIPAALTFLQKSEPMIGCIGSAFAARNQSLDGSSATERVDAVDRSECRISEYQIPSQLGLFTTEMFLDGVRFETTGAFGQAGWGLEDTDFAFQMLAAGYMPLLVSSFVYVHARSGSSVTQLEAGGHSVSDGYYERLEILREKWADVAPVGTRFLRHLVERNYYDPRL